MGLLLLLASVLMWGTLLYLLVRRRVPFDDPSAPRVREVPYNGHVLLLVIAFLFTALAAVGMIAFGLGLLPIVVIGGVVVWAAWKGSRGRPVIDVEQPWLLGHGTRNSLLFISLPPALLIVGTAVLIVEKSAWLMLPVLAFSGFLVAWIWWLAFQARRDGATDRGGGTAA